MSTPTGCPVEANLRHLEMRGLRPSSIGARHAALRRCARFFGLDAGEDLLLLAESDLNAWQLSMVHLAPNTRSSEIVQVRQFFAFCVRHGYLDRDPSGILVPPKIPERVPHPIPAEDLDTAIAFASRRIRPMLVLAAYCGLRACEIAWLTREQVHDQGDAPTLVVIGKGNKQRVIPLPPRVLEELRTYGLPMEGPVFGRGDDPTRQSSPQQISHLCNEYLHSLGIPESLHKLRHYYGTSMYAASKDIVLVQRSMGHTSPQTTSGYVAHDQSAAHAAAATVAGLARERQRARLKVVGAAPVVVIPQPVTTGMGGPAGRGPLSERELQVLRLVADGKTNRAVGQALGVSVDSVRSHLRGIGRKLGVGERAGMVAVAMRIGLVA